MKKYLYSGMVALITLVILFWIALSFNIHWLKEPAYSNLFFLTVIAYWLTFWTVKKISQK